MTAGITATASAAPDIDAIPADTFERVVRALDIAYFEWTAGSDKMCVSAALADMFGLDPNTWSTRHHLELMHPDDVHAYHTALIAYFKSDKDRTQFSFRARDAGGAYRWVRTHTLAERDAAGRVTRLTGTVSDITQAKEREARNRGLIAREAASIEVLKAISALPDDPQPVFELIARRARELCGAARASVTEFDGALLHMRARDGYDAATSQLGDLDWPRTPDTDTIHGRVVLSRNIVHVRDLNNDSDYGESSRDMMRRLGSRSLLGVPLLRAGRVVGSIVLGRPPTGGFDAAEVALVEAFAEQAVIAIASATTLGELRARTAELATRNSEYGERIEQQSATIDVLKVMSASPGDARPVFQLIVERARAFCEADRAMVALLDRDLLHLQAHTGMTTAGARDYETQFPRPADAATMFGRAILARNAVQTPDVWTDPQHFARASAGGSGDRSIIAVPLMRTGSPIGSIAIGRERPGEFSTTQLELLQTFAEQAVIAIGSAETYRELQARTAELAQRNSEYGERIEQQSATIDVLKAMSASPGDTQPVFDLITRRARELCNGVVVGLTEYDGELIHVRSTSAIIDPAAHAAFLAQFPMPPTSASIACRAILEKQIIHIRDADTEPGLFQSIRDNGTKSILALPLLRDDAVIGSIALNAMEPGGFSDSQIALLQTFAEQAVIAIGSAETYRELQERTAALAARNSEYGERIEQQSATIDVLKVMSSSPGDAQPVFELIARRALEFCGATGTRLIEFDGTLQHLRALVRADGIETEADRALRQMYPAAPDHDSIAGRVIVQRAIIHSRDDAETPSGWRGRYAGSVVGIPLLRDDRVFGAIMLSLSRSGGFSETQIELLQTFAEQAVIAIGSAETYRELQARTAALAERNSEYGERIAHQAATIDVLKAMSASPGDAQRVFDLVVHRASELCNSSGAGLLEFDGEQVHFRSAWGVDPAEVRAYAAIFPMTPTRASIACRAILDKQVIHIRDMDAEPAVLQVARNLGMKSNIALPLLRDGAAIGALTLTANELGGFSDSQVSLLQTFAEQAVIAIGSAATYRELQARTAALAERNSEYGERIEHQSATIDVLKAMSASPGDARPVFELIVERARAICDTDYAMTALLDDEMLHLQTHTGMTVAQAQNYEVQFPRPVTAESVFGRAILSRAAVCIPDSRLDPEYGFKALITVASRSLAAVPMLRAGSPIGAIALGRYKPGDYSAAQMELLQTFAEQAVIAIGSAETYRELQARTAALAERNSEYGERIEHQSATIDVLKAMSASPDDTQPVFDLIARRAQQLCNGASVGLFEFDGKLVYARASAGGNQAAIAAFQGMFPMEPTRGSLACRAILDRQIVHVHDMNAEPGLLPAVRDMGAKSTLSLPLLRDNKAIGALSLNSKVAGGFSDNQIELLKTFAEQAVIAVGSADTFRELRDRTAALTRSVAELQALEEVLRAVNSSLDLETVLATIISRAVQLSQADEGTIYEFDETDEVFVPKAAFGMTSERVEALRERRIRIGETPLGNSAAMRAPLHIPDLTQALDTDGARELVADDIHALLAVPLLREDKIVGGLVIRRRAAGGFAPTIPTLLQTFAGQSVLAIENARLFQDARRARNTAEAALVDLRRAQDRLVQSEKMASLGQLTAGIAHEIKNPLNFVNNFADLSVDLLDELHDAVTPDKLVIAADLRAEIDDLTETLKSNLEKIAQHGRRADSIVKNMLLHSRSGPSEHRAIDLNTTVEEALNLAYHGARAETPGFNITLEKELDPRAGTAELYPQEFIRVMLNLIGNGFYAARNRANRTADNGFEPTLRLATRDMGEHVEIRVRDNGTGISDAVRDKIFEPFFTTKPAGEGTGLGLSLSYDIVVKQHGGQLTVDSQTDAFTEFVITLPRKMLASNGGRP